jgi:hypothetical protein
MNSFLPTSSKVTPLPLSESNALSTKEVENNWKDKRYPRLIKVRIKNIYKMFEREINLLQKKLYNETSIIVFKNTGIDHITTYEDYEDIVYDIDYNYSYQVNIQNLYYLFNSTIQFLGDVLSLNEKLLRESYNEQNSVVKKIFDNVTNNNLFSELEEDYLNFCRNINRKIKKLKQNCFLKLTIKVDINEEIERNNFIKKKFSKISKKTDESFSNELLETEENDSSENDSSEKDSLLTRENEILKLITIFKKLFDFYSKINNYVVEEKEKKQNYYGGKKKTRGKTRKTKKNIKKSQRNRKS